MGEVSRSVKRYLTDILGEADTSKYLEYISQDPAQYLRVNLLKISLDTLQRKLLDRI